MPTRDKQRVYAELNGFKMAVRELNESLKAQARSEKPVEFGPYTPQEQSPEAEYSTQADAQQPAQRFVAAASTEVARNRRKRQI